MATSGTTSFDLDFVEIVEEAYERCGTELRSGYDLKTARRSLNLLFAEWANRGINMWTIEQGSVPLLAGTGSYALPADTVDLLDHVIRQTNGTVATDLTATRISMPAYSAIPNKAMQGRPLQIMVTRGQAAPSISVWPIPADGTYTLVYWRLRRIKDAGNGANTMDVPFRFIPALTAGLAYYLALKVPGAYERLQPLKLMYEEEFQRAADEDRERATLRLVPRVYV
jgi:hypothetical protein